MDEIIDAARRAINDSIQETICDLHEELGELKEYLLRHEYDIAIGINDFSDLERVFIYLHGREPSDDGQR